MNRTKDLLQRELQDSRQELKAQLSVLNSEIVTLSRQEQLLVDKKRNITEREKQLQTILQEAKARYSKLKRRHALEMEGYQNEALTLRKRLQQLKKVLDKRSEEIKHVQH